MKKRFSKILGVAVTLAMLGSLIIAPMAGAVSSASVIVAPAVISSPANYTITFDVVAAVPATGIVTVQFPIGTTVPITAAWVAGDVTLQSTAGFGTAISVQNWDPTQIATTAGSALAGPIVAMTVTTGAAPAFPNGIGEGATVRIKFNNLVVTNPSAIASYTLTVKTDQVGDTTAVASQAYALTAPVVPALPGIVEVYNSTGILMASQTGAGAIQTSLNAAGAGFTIKIGPGTYNESPNTPAGFTGMTIMSSSSAADTLVTGNWAVTQASTTISGLTLANAVAGVGAPTVNVTGNLSAITGCVFTKAGTALTAVAEAAGLLAFNVGAPTGYASATNCTFDSTLGAVQDSALIINQNGVSVSGCTFAVDATLAGAGDTAITINGGSLALPVALTGVTVTGSSGIGIQGTSGVASITDVTLDTLNPAMNLVAGAYTVKDSTITNSGTAVSVTVPTGLPAINIADAGAPPTLTISNSTLTGNLNDILEVDATGSENPNLITLMWNDLSGNALGIDNNNVFTVGGTVNAMVNWWGASTGPAAAFNGGLVNANGALGNLGATGTVVQGAAATVLRTSTTFGVDVEPQTAAGAAWVSAAGDFIGVGHYAANPEEATPQPALTDGIYDVFFANGSGAALNNILIKIFNPNITATTVVMVWSDLQGAWSNCTVQGINLFSGFAWINVTAASVPSILNLSGTPFALVEPVVVPVVPVIGMTGSPIFGAIAAPIQPTFTWSAVAGATSYEFVLAEEIGQDDKFAIIDYSATTEINGHVAREQLKYDTVYNWRVRAVNATGPSPWATSFFTTVTEPVPPAEPVPPVVIKETPPTPAPEIILQVPPATKQEVQVIPDYLLWVVVAVGAVLIIAVVVLIVRTRRVV